MKAEPELAVFVQQTRVGLFRTDHLERVLFVPDPEWLESGQNPPLGLSFLRDPTSRRGPDYRTLPDWFENLLPEKGSRLRSWISQQQSIEPRDSLSLIAALGNDLVGAVSIQGSSPEADPQLAPNALTEDPPIRFSLAGMQLKLSMLESGERFVLPAHDQLGQWIVKIPGSSYIDLPEVEAATMQWARQTGLDTPEFCVRPMDALTGLSRESLGESPTLFAIRRFDRMGQRRIHQEDFAQALEFSPLDKYGSTNRGIGYDLLTRLVLDTCGPAAAEDFVRRVAFMLACGNDDAHLKNWSFQWLEERPSLSPSYDLVSTISWDAFGWGRERAPELALSFGRKKRFSELTLDRLDTFVRRSGLDSAREVFCDGLERARSQWGEIQPICPPRMRQALPKHWRNTPILNHFGTL